MKPGVRSTPAEVNCVVSRDSQPGALFSHPPNQSFRVPDSFPATYQGNQVSVGQLEVGSTALITLDSSEVPVGIEVAYFPDLRNRANELYRNVEAISQLEVEFGASVDQAISELMEFKLIWLQWLEKEKEQFLANAQHAAREVERCLEQGDGPISPAAEGLLALPLE